MVLQNYQNFIKMTSNMIYFVAFGNGLKCPRKIHLNTQWGAGGFLCRTMSRVYIHFFFNGDKKLFSYYFPILIAIKTTFRDLSTFTSLTQNNSSNKTRFEKWKENCIKPLRTQAHQGKKMKNALNCKMTPK